jgi:flagellar motor switch/type III secretory pathway protein FliN
MKSDPAEQVEVAGAGGEISDPFAVDFFATARAATADPAAAPPPAEGPPFASEERPWHAALAKVTREEVRRSAALAAVEPSLPPRAREALGRVLARLARVEPDDVQTESLGTRETALAEFAGTADGTRAPRVVLSLSIEPDGAPAALALEADFASALADRLLGGEGSPPVALRRLSDTERAVVEFLCLSTVRELNALAGEPLLRLDAVTETFSPRLAARFGPRVLVSTVRVAAGQAVGLARLVLGDEALAALGPGRNALLARGRGEGGGGKFLAYKKLAAGVPLRLRLGETRLRALDLGELGAGDVVLIERPQAGLELGRLGERVSVRAGAAGGVVFEGSVREAAAGEGNQGAALGLTVESVSGGAGREGAGRFLMEDEGRLESAAEGAAALEGLLLTVHVELPARRISLEELSRLRVGQVLELGCRPTDTVELVAEDRRVAAGELVDIEGRLGVRITSLFG